MRAHPLYAASYDFLTGPTERRILGPIRSTLIGEATGRVLEVGAGTGANFPHYREADKIVATEPDPFMLARARKRAADLEINVEFRDSPVEELPFADATFDTVVATLVLCTVRGQERSFGEIRRVLRPGGEFRFIEHVRAEGGIHALAQDVLAPVWSLAAANCRPNRRTDKALAAAGFDIRWLDRQWKPITPFVFGVAVPAGSDSVLGER